MATTTILLFFLSIASTSYAQGGGDSGEFIPTYGAGGGGIPAHGGGGGGGGAGGGGGTSGDDTVPFTGVPLPYFGGSPPGTVPFTGSPPAGTVPYTGSPPSGATPYTDSPPSGTVPYTGSPPSATTPYTGSPPSPTTPYYSASPPLAPVGCSCFFWATHPQAWPPFLGAFGSTVQSIFGGICSHFFGPQLTLMVSLRSASADPHAYLLREGTAALLNSYTRPGHFPYTAQYVKARVNTALASRRAAAVQAAKFARANALYGAGCKV